MSEVTLLEGNGVSVSVRVRPFIKEEQLRGDESKLCVAMPTMQTVEMTDDVGEVHGFNFDRAYWSHDPQHPFYATQETLYQELGKAMLGHAITGFNTCIFAYGQTGSGKSYSVLGSGTGEGRGLLPRIVQGFFEHFDAACDQTTCACIVSFVEVYNEHVHDLLAANTEEASNLKVRSHPVLGAVIVGLREEKVCSKDSVMELIELGTSRRTVKATAMNQGSSRSHCIFTFKTSVTQPDGVAKVSQTHLVDLAGSERASRTQAEGERLKEGAAINKSLSTLARVIHVLAEHAAGKTSQKPPFRDSKLTHILKESLSGNSKTVMMAAISPSSADYEETMSTLRFAQSVKKVQLRATANEVANISDKAVVLQLQEQLTKMRANMAGLKLVRAMEAQHFRAKAANIVHSTDSGSFHHHSDTSGCSDDEDHLEPGGSSSPSHSGKGRDGRSDFGAEMVEFRSRIAAAEASVSARARLTVQHLFEAKSEIDDLKRQLEASKDDAARSACEVASLTSRLADSDAELLTTRALATEIESAASKERAMSAEELSCAMQEVGSARQDGTSVAAELASAKLNIAGLEHDLDARRVELAGARAAAMAASVEKGKLDAELASAKAEAVSLREQLDASQGESALAESTSTVELHAMRSTLERSETELRSEIDARRELASELEMSQKAQSAARSEVDVQECLATALAADLRLQWKTESEARSQFDVQVDEFRGELDETRRALSKAELEATEASDAGLGLEEEVMVAQAKTATLREQLEMQVAAAAALHFERRSSGPDAAAGGGGHPRGQQVTAFLEELTHVRADLQEIKERLPVGATVTEHRDSSIGDTAALAAEEDATTSMAAEASLLQNTSLVTATQCVPATTANHAENVLCLGCEALVVEPARAEAETLRQQLQEANSALFKARKRLRGKSCCGF